MAKSKKKPAGSATEPLAQAKQKVDAARTIFGKQREKAANDPKRRLAHKKLKRAQRTVRGLVAVAKRVEAAKAKKAAAAGA